MRPYLHESFFNPSAIYLDAKQIRQDIEQARKQVAGVLGSRPDEIIFTAGATESCNLAIKGVMQQFPDANMLISSIEHSAVIQPAKAFDTRNIAVEADGLIDVQNLEQTIDDKTVLISIIYANNEIGVVQNLSEISKMIARVRDRRRLASNSLPIYLHTDAAQAASYLDLHVARLCIDLMTLNGGKMYGPKQTGILYVRAGVKITPQIEGGGQEFGLRSGTENVAGIVGFATALSEAQSMRRDEVERLSTIQSKLFEELSLLEIPGLVINGSIKHRLANNVNFSLPDQDGERLIMALDEVGIQCATGAACSALTDESSHVIKALGRSENEARGSIRVTMGRSTAVQDIDDFLERLKKLCA
jgi:cysteine desulfurase